MGITAALLLAVAQGATSPIQNLEAVDPTTSSSKTLTWTTPYEWEQGYPSLYEGRCSLSNPGPDVDDAWWNSSMILNGLPLPQAQAGSPETFLVAGLLSNRTYYFALRSIDSLGVPSAYSNPATGDTLVDGVPPGMPAGLALLAIGPTSIQASWINSGDDGPVGTASRIRLCISTDSNVTAPGWIAASMKHDVSFAEASTQPQAETIPGLGAETTYFVRVIAYDDADQPSPPSASASVTTPASILEVGVSSGGSRCSAGAGTGLLALLLAYAIAASKASI